MADGSTNYLAIVGGTIIDGNGGPPLDDGVILIGDNRIVAVGDGSTALPPKVNTISAVGQYVMPGMMDANVHLFLVATPYELIKYEGRYDELITEAAQIALKSGLTTVFDTWGPRESLTRVRDRINRGELVGSRVFFAGNIIGLGGPTSAEFFPQARTVLGKSRADAIDMLWEQGVGAELLWMSPPEVRTRIREYLHSGTQDFLKYAASGHAQFQFICFSEQVQRVIVEEGHRAGLTVQAHSTSAESLRMEIDAGADLLQHPDLSGMSRIPDETLDVIARQRIPCAALFATRRYLAWSNAHGSEPLRTFHHIKDENGRRLVAANASILLTTDAGVLPVDIHENPWLGDFAKADDCPITLGEGHFLWLTAAIELGMKPMDALMAATSQVARAYHVYGDLGTLEKGKIADVLVLDKNPLAHPAHYRSISQVIKDGRIVDRASLPTRKLLTAQSETSAQAF